MKFESRHIGNRTGKSGMLIRVLMMGAIVGIFLLLMRQVPSLMDEMTDITAGTISHTGTYWPECNEPLIQHSTFTLAYDEEHEQAKWVAYILTREELNRKYVKRSDWYEEDKMVPTGSANYYDYKGSGYTKGHLVPSADRAWSRKANAETFLLSNISPQAYHFNGGVWRELEENVRDWARDNERLFIVTGPITRNSQQKIGHNKVTVPEAFFKVLLDLDLPEQKAIGFLIPNEMTDQPLEYFMVSVDQVEDLTGIDFFHLLINSDSLEDKLESEIDEELWPVSKKRFNIRRERWNKN